MSNITRNDGYVMGSSSTSLIDINYRNNNFVDKDLSTNTKQTVIEESQNLETSWCSDTSSNNSDSSDDEEDHNIWENDCEWQVRELQLQSEKDQDTIEQNVFNLMKFRSLHWDLKKQPGCTVQKFNERQINEQTFETMRNLCLQNIEYVNIEVFHSFMKPVHTHSTFLAFKQLHSNLRTSRHLTHTHHKDKYIQSLDSHHKLRHRSFLKNKISEQLHSLQTSQTHSITNTQIQSGGQINNLNNFKSSSHAPQQFKRTDNRSYTQAPRLQNPTKIIKPTLEDFADPSDGLTQTASADQNNSQKVSQIEQKELTSNNNLIHHKAIISQSTKPTIQSDVLLRYNAPNDSANQKVTQTSLTAKNNNLQNNLSSKPVCGHSQSVMDSDNQWNKNLTQNEANSSKIMNIFSSPLNFSSDIKSTNNQSTPNTIRESTITKEQQLSLHCSPQLNKLSMINSKVITPPNQPAAATTSLNLLSQKKIPQKDSFLLPSIVGQHQPKRLSQGNDLIPVKSLKESVLQQQTKEYQHKIQQSNQSMPNCSQESQFSIPLKLIAQEQQANSHNINTNKNSIVINSFRHRYLKTTQQAQDEQSASFAQDNSMEKNNQNSQVLADKASSFNSQKTASTQHSSSTARKQFASPQICFQSHLSGPDTPQSQLSNNSPTQTNIQTAMPSLPAKKICSTGNLSSLTKNTTPINMLSKTSKHMTFSCIQQQNGSTSVSDPSQSRISKATLSTFSEHVSYLDRNNNKNCQVSQGEIQSRENLSEQSLYQLNNKNQYQTPLSLRAQLKISANSSLVSSQKRNDDSLIKADISSVSTNQCLFFGSKVSSPQTTKIGSPFQDEGRITNKIFNQLKDQRLKVPSDSPNISRQPFQRGKQCASLFKSQITP